jgi:histidyl-tRNA synthetase
MGYHNYDYAKKGIPAGTVERFGEEMSKQKHVIDIIESVYQEFGFDPFDTPTLEKAEVFKGHHGEGEEILFHLSDSQSSELVLRYDLTVPLARYIADHPEAPIPFKRYQVASVFRDDEVDKGHFREFIQCDGDIVGINDLTADAEVIDMAYKGLTKLGFKNFVINVSHRKIINGIASKCGLSSLEVQRCLDKVSKFLEKHKRDYPPMYYDGYNTTPPNVEKEWQKHLDHGIDSILSAQGITGKAKKAIVSLFEMHGNFDTKIKRLADFLENSSEGIVDIEELKEIINYLTSEVKRKVNLDLSLARGADYYTGFILEGSVPGVDVGAILGGGRFDRLVKDLGGPDLPAVGMAFGLDRIMVCMKELNILKNLELSDKILIAPQSETKKEELLILARRCREANINVDFIFFPNPTHSSDDIEEYAKARGFSVLITGNDSGLKVKGVNGINNTTLIESLMMI